jgi:hypothetical protein
LVRLLEVVLLVVEVEAENLQVAVDFLVEEVDFLEGAQAVQLE